MWGICVKEIKVGDTVYFHGDCLTCGKIFKTIVTEVISKANWKEYKLLSYDDIAYDDEIELNEEDSFREAETAKQTRINSLKSQQILLESLNFEIFEI